MASQDVVRFHARERRRALVGVSELFRTHYLYDVAGGAIPVATIDTDELFPVRSGLITFATAIRVVDNGGVHSGLVFEFGDAGAGCALWLGDQTIGFHAGAAGDDDGATAIFDHGGELPAGLHLGLVAAVNVGSGRVRLWGNGRELARAQATNETFDPQEWSGGGAGSFAANESGTVVTDVPAGSRQAPDGFEVVLPLSVFAKQAPSHFV